jgi:glycine/D-amino acid oxidase-like deaminating enzyme
LIGGGGHFSGLRVNREKRYQKLANYAEERFGVTEITHRWSDRDYLSYDGIPLVGPLYPWSKNLYVGTGFKKWGLSNGTAAAMILCDLISNKENPWASTFYPHRPRLVTSIPRVVIENIKANI